MVPEGWSEKSLKNLVKKDRSISYGIVQTGEHIEDGVLCVRVVDFAKKKVSVFDMIRTSQKISRSYKRTVLELDDIVFALRGEIGEVIKIGRELLGANLTRGVALISPDTDQVHPEYLLWAIRSGQTRKEILLRVNGSALKEIPIAELRRVRVPVPPLPEQKKIAAILSTWDRAIDLTASLIAAKEKQKKALMQQLLTGQRRFKEFEGEKWKRVSIGSLLKEVERPVEWNDEQQYNLLSVRRNSNGLFLREKRYGREIMTKNMKVAFAGDFLISKMQVLHGALALTTAEFHGMHISGSYIALVSKDSDTFDIRFFDWLSRTPQLYHLAYLSSHGVAIEKMSFSLRDFLKKKITVPTCIEEQRKIVAVLSTYEREISSLNNQLNLIKNQKKP